VLQPLRQRVVGALRDAEPVDEPDGLAVLGLHRLAKVLLQQLAAAQQVCEHLEPEGAEARALRRHTARPERVSRGLGAGLPA
jgi:hypothetical protein